MYQPLFISTHELDLNMRNQYARARNLLRVDNNAHNRFLFPGLNSKSARHNNGNESKNNSKNISKNKKNSNSKKQNHSSPTLSQPQIRKIQESSDINTKDQWLKAIKANMAVADGQDVEDIMTQNALIDGIRTSTNVANKDVLLVEELDLEHDVNAQDENAQDENGQYENGQYENEKVENQEDENQQDEKQQITNEQVENGQDENEQQFHQNPVSSSEQDSGAIDTVVNDKVQMKCNDSTTDELSFIALEFRYRYEVEISTSSESPELAIALVEKRMDQALSQYLCGSLRRVRVLTQVSRGLDLLGVSSDPHDIIANGKEFVSLIAVIKRSLFWCK